MWIMCRDSLPRARAWRIEGCRGEVWKAPPQLGHQGQHQDGQVLWFISIPDMLGMAFLGSFSKPIPSVWWGNYIRQIPAHCSSKLPRSSRTRKVWETHSLQEPVRAMIRNCTGVSWMASRKRKYIDKAETWIKDGLDHIGVCIGSLPKKCKTLTTKKASQEPEGTPLSLQLFCKSKPA